MSKLARTLAAATLLAAPLAATTPADATTVPCAGAYAATGVASQKCTFVYAGGSITATISITGAAGHKYVTLGVYPGGRWCEDESYSTSASCSFTFNPGVAIGTVMTCSTAAVGRPSGTVSYSCR